jgi:outer membrane protein OmpA-like peptidoglycan-associated protein
LASAASLKAMKNLIFLLFGLFGLFGLNAFGLKYETGLDTSQWVNDGSRFSCRLEHYITGFGTGAFVHNAGEDRRLALDGQGIAFGGESVIVRAVPPNWRPGGNGLALGQLKPVQGEVQVGETLATNIASELLGGMMITFEGALRESVTQPIAVQLSTVGFRKAFDDFAICEDQLAAASFSQLERSRIQYKVGQIELGATGKRLLSKIANYLGVDSTVQQIFIDGHTDDTGLTRDNIVMSRQRAERVRDYLLGKGVPKEMLVVRFHAEKYPVARNTSAGNREKNRRTTVRLSREYEPQPQVIEETDEIDGVDERPAVASYADSSESKS